MFVKVYESVENRDLICEAVDFLIKELGLGDSSLSISLRVFGKRKEGVAGETFINKTQAICSVYAKSLDAQRVIESVAHELYHAKQASDGRLKPVGDGLMEFDGVVYDQSHQTDLPYEVEADVWANSISKNFYLNHFTFSSLGV